MNDEIVYIHLNNWFPGDDYPDAEPFLTWLGDDSDLRFLDEKWVKENKLCVVKTFIDMSVNFDITTTKSWVMENCPKLLSDETITTTFNITGKDGTRTEEKVYPYSKYLCHPEEDDNEVYDKFGIKFLPYKEENFGITDNGDWDKYYDEDE